MKTLEVVAVLDCTEEDEKLIIDRMLHRLRSDPMYDCIIDFSVKISTEFAVLRREPLADKDAMLVIVEKVKLSAPKKVDDGDGASG